MKRVLQILRFVLPVPFGLVLAGVLTINSVWVPQSALTAVLCALAVLIWPRLWVLAPFPVIDMYAYSSGATFRGYYTNLAANASTIMMAIPLLLIGLSSAFRKLPGPRPDIQGTIVPNADGVGALLALPVVIGLAATGRFGLLLILALIFAAIRIIGYARKNELFTRGRGWVAFAAATVVALLYYFQWSAGDMEGFKYYGPRCSLPIGIFAWAIQRAVIPFRNPTTQP